MHKGQGQAHTATRPDLDLDGPGSGLCATGRIPHLCTHTSVCNQGLLRWSLHEQKGQAQVAGSSAAKC